MRLYVYVLWRNREVYHPVVSGKKWSSFLVFMTCVSERCVGGVKFCQTKKRKGRWFLLDCYALASTILAIGAFFFIDSMPLTHVSFDSYASLSAIFCPF